MSKMLFKVLLVMWLVLIVLDLWLQEYALIAITGLGITIYSYYSQQVKRLSGEVEARIMSELNRKTVSFVFLCLVLVSIVGFWFNVHTLPTTETVYVALGGLLMYRGISIRRSMATDTMTYSHVSE